MFLSTPFLFFSLSLSFSLLRQHQVVRASNTWRSAAAFANTSLSFSSLLFSVKKDFNNTVLWIFFQRNESLLRERLHTSQTHFLKNLFPRNFSLSPPLLSSSPSPPSALHLPSSSPTTSVPSSASSCVTDRKGLHTFVIWNVLRKEKRKNQTQLLVLILLCKDLRTPTMTIKSFLFLLLQKYTHAVSLS